MLTLVTCCLAVTSLLVILPAPATSSAVVQTSLDELRSSLVHRDLDKLRRVFREDGIIAITGLSSDYQAALKTLKVKGPDCFKQVSLPEYTMSDGSERTTFATSSGETGNYPTCIEDSAKTISAEFDLVFGEVAQLFEALSGASNLQWRSEDASEPQSFESLPKKEHIHVYHPSAAAAEGFALPFHTDNGILLLLTPFQEHPLQVRNSLGNLLDTSQVQDDALLIIIARALPTWLLRGVAGSQAYFPAPHAVRSLSNAPRTVFARMMVAPMDAVPANTKHSNKRFHEIFLNEEVGGDEFCTHFTKQRGVAGWEEFQREAACPEGTSYCWMGCMVQPPCLPGLEPVCLNNSGDACCTDPEDEGTGTCADMDGSCAWTCS